MAKGYASTFKAGFPLVEYIGFLLQYYRTSGFSDTHGEYGYQQSVDNCLEPEYPSPGRVPSNETRDEGAEPDAEDGGSDKHCHWAVALVCLVRVCDDAADQGGKDRARNTRPEAGGNHTLKHRVSVLYSQDPHSGPRDDGSMRNSYPPNDSVAAQPMVQMM
jgi:hypothetical protein